jgi:hypothetical protein
MANLVFQSGSTWRRLGFALYSNSLSYREVLENNPTWSVVKNPPLGTILNPGSVTGSVTSVGLTQQSPVLSSATTSAGDFFPFPSQESYAESLSRYTRLSLRDVERNNGWSAASVHSDTGNQ